MKVDMSEDLFRDILERLPEAVVLLDRQGRIRYVNQTANRVVEKTPLQIGTVLWEVAPAPVARAIQAVFERILGGDEMLVLRSYFARGRWYEFLAYPAGHEIALLGRDITERLQAEALRRQSEQRFEILIEGVKDYAIVLLDPEGRFSSWNAGAERLYGYRAEEVLGKDTALFYPPEQAQSARDNLEAAVARGHHEEEGWRVRKDGSQLLVNALFYPLYDELSQPSGFAVVHRDITAQRRIEQNLRTSEERLRQALDAAGLGAWEYQIETDQWLADARSLALYGLPPRSAPYTRQEGLARIYPDDLERVREAQERAVQGGSYHAEYRLAGGSDPEERWLEGHGKALVDETGKPIRVIGVLRDVTERHRSDKFRTLLPGVVAHDLRSPLQTAKMAGQALLNDATLPASSARYAQAILRSVDQMAHMTDELLDFTQACFGGGIPLDRKPADLADIAREAVLAARIRCPECEFEFAAQGPSQGLWDRTRILEVVTNLLSNAVKHGSRAEPIAVAVRGEGDHVTAAVHNSGAPISAALMPVIFDPFRRVEYSTSRQSDQKSYGLGLYIIREIVVAHGGTIEVRSSRETGTIFTVRLPREASATATPDLR
jgi:PAS domain S-box-containing protein